MSYNLLNFEVQFDVMTGPTIFQAFFLSCTCVSVTSVDNISPRTLDFKSC